MMRTAPCASNLKKSLCFRESDTMLKAVWLRPLALLCWPHDRCMCHGTETCGRIEGGRLTALLGPDSPDMHSLVRVLGGHAPRGTIVSGCVEGTSGTVTCSLHNWRHRIATASKASPGLQLVTA